jgi:hypothetical protein
MTLEQTMKQHPPLGNRFLISKNMQLLLSNAFTNKHVHKEMIEVQQWTVFSALSMPVCYKEDNWSKSPETCKGVCEEKT